MALTPIRSCTENAVMSGYWDDEPVESMVGRFRMVSTNVKIVGVIPADLDARLRSGCLRVVLTVMNQL